MDFTKLLGFGFAACIGLPLIAKVIVDAVYPECLRCSKRKPVWKLLKYNNLHMCEPCENIAQYYAGRRD